MATVDDRLAKLERHLRGLDQELNNLASVTAKVATVIANQTSGTSESDEDKTHGSANPDHIWVCRKCGARLGFYDPVEDLLRVRYKDFVTYIHIGAGGYVQVLCRSCSEMNTANWESEEPAHLSQRSPAGAKSCAG